MLNFIRERAQGWLAWIIIGLLIIPFALWGINEYFGNGNAGASVATVNGQEISQGEFQQVYFEQRNRMQEMLGEQYDPDLMDADIRRGVIDQLVERELLRQYAEENGYVVSADVVANTIRSLEAFQEDGVFSSALYEEQIRAQGQTTAMFESRLHQAILLSQLPAALVNTSFVTDADVNAAIALEQQRRDVDYLVLATERYRNLAAADAAAVQAYYDQNTQRYMTDEQVRVEYVELSAAMMPRTVPDDETLKAFFDSRAQEFQVPEERQFRHILVQVGQHADEQTVAAAQAKAADLLARITAGESFEKLAKAYSDDPGSAPRGGDLGYVSRGRLTPAFEQAGFALGAKGQVSEPVRTSFGFHLIKLENIRPARVRSLAEVRSQLLAGYQQEQAEKTYFELADQLTTLAFENPDSLREIAAQLNLEVKQSPLLTRAGGSGLFSHPRLVAAAFSDEVLRQGFNSDPVNVDDNHVVVLRLLDHQEAQQLPLDEVRELVKAQVVLEAARQVAADAAKAALGRLLSGEDMTAVAKSLGAAWRPAARLTRTAQEVAPAVVSEAFRLARPTAGAATYGSATLGNGDVALIRLTGVTDGDAAAADEATRDAVKRRLAGIAGSDAQRLLLEALKAEARIIINTEDL